MKVELIDYTGIGCGEKYAPALLIFTKETRLKLESGRIDDIENWEWEKINEELLKMSNTIPSSWEFINYTFLISDVSRAFTHQLVRTRAGSYAQQTMRVLDVSGFNYITGPSILEDVSLDASYQSMMAEINSMYEFLIANGAEIEDARGVLPTNICTNIVAKFNLRTIAELVTKRSSPRTQGEYRDYINCIVDLILQAHPWAHIFLRNRKIDAASELDKFIQQVFLEDGSDYKMHLMKQVDILRQS